MTYHVWTLDDNGDPVEIEGRVRSGTFVVAESAAEGSVGISDEVWIDDVPATFEIKGHRKFWIVEDAAVGDPYVGVLFAGFTGERTVARDPEHGHIVGAARRWRVQLVDVNTILDRRILTGTDAARPAETDVARIAWLLATDEVAADPYAPIDDDTYVSSADPVSMSATDYTGQSVLSVLDDCAQQSGKEFWVMRRYSGDPTDPVAYGLWYGKDELEAFASTAWISNDLDDLPDAIAPSMETSLAIRPDRVYTGVYQAYDGGYVYRQRAQTGEEFLTSRDTVAQGENVKTASAARARATRYLNDVRQEEEEITTAVLVESAHVNRIVAGHRVPVRYTHLPGYDGDPVWMRVKERTVVHVTPYVYELRLRLTRPPEQPPAAAVYGVLYYAHGPNAGGLVGFERPGDNPPPGWWHRPTVGPLTPVQDTNQPADRQYVGIQCDGDGKIDVRFYCSTVGVAPTGTFTVTWAILRNGVAVAETVVEETFTGGLTLYGSQAEVTVADLEVADGDLISARLTCDPPTIYYFRTPRGTGIGGEQLEITGGSLS